MSMSEVEPSEAVGNVLMVAAGEKSLKTATSQDIIKFLIRRDKFGKMVVHSPNVLPLLENNSNHS